VLISMQWSQQPPSIGSTPCDLITGMAASPREGFINSLAAPAGAIRRWLSLEEGIAIRPDQTLDGWAVTGCHRATCTLAVHAAARCQARKSCRKLSSMSS